MEKNLARARARAKELADLPAQLGALDNMTVAQLSEWYRQLYGEPPRTRHRRALQKRLAFRLQEQVLGGLSSEAQATINALGTELPQRWRMRLAASPTVEPQASAQAAPPRDARLPTPGSVVRRIYRGKLYEATVEEKGFSFLGKSYRSLSAIAKQITGTAWNGFDFFELNGHREPA